MKLMKFRDKQMFERKITEIFTESKTIAVKKTAERNIDLPKVSCFCYVAEIRLCHLIFPWKLKLRFSRMLN